MATVGRLNSLELLRSSGRWLAKCSDQLVIVWVLKVEATMAKQSDREHGLGSCSTYKYRV